MLASPPVVKIGGASASEQVVGPRRRQRSVGSTRGLAPHARRRLRPRAHARSDPPGIAGDLVRRAGHDRDRYWLVERHLARRARDRGAASRLLRADEAVAGRHRDVGVGRALPVRALRRTRRRHDRDPRPAAVRTAGRARLRCRARRRLLLRLVGAAGARLHARRAARRRRYVRLCACQRGRRNGLVDRVGSWPCRGRLDQPVRVLRRRRPRRCSCAHATSRLRFATRCSRSAARSRSSSRRSCSSHRGTTVSSTGFLRRRRTTSPSASGTGQAGTRSPCSRSRSASCSSSARPSR